MLKCQNTCVRENMNPNLIQIIHIVTYFGTHGGLAIVFFYLRIRKSLIEIGIQFHLLNNCSQV